MDFFDSAYQGRPPWDIGRPQKEFVDLVGRGGIQGSVLDIGCGTGEDALFFAGIGLDVWGIDTSPLAIERAKEKAAERGLLARFLIMNALEITKIGRKFDNATDSGFFHTLSDGDRVVFVNNLAAVLLPGGTYFMLCFSDLEPAGYGPRRISKAEIEDSFRDGWAINYIRPAIFESLRRTEGSHAWFSSISRRQGSV